MTITSVNPTITVNSPAKTGTLGAQGVIDPDQIVLDTSLNAVNEGTVADPLIGRLICLRRGEVDSETKQIVEGADTDTTIRVHEDWDSPPVSGDTYDISYVLGDTISLTGASLSTKTGVYEFSRNLKVGAGTVFAWIAIKGQEAMENRDGGASNPLTVDSFGRLDVGFTRAGNAADGGLMNTINNVDGEPGMLFNSGSEVRLLDAISFSYRASTTLTGDPDAVVDANGWKNVKIAYESDLRGSGSYRNISWTGVSSSTDTVIIDQTTVIDTWALNGTSGFHTIVGNTSAETLLPTARAYVRLYVK